VDLKGRQPGKPFLLLVPDRRTAHAMGLVFTPAAQALADRFWPGPLTLVLSGGDALPAMLRGPEQGIAVRWTSHRGTAALLTGLGSAITSTSANRPGGPTAPGVGALTTTFDEAVQDGTLLILDGGVLGNVPPSTIVNCMAPNERPRVIREGAIPLAELRASVGTLAP
jgi:L-threonylcarbamoyladenylate synthase